MLHQDFSLNDFLAPSIDERIDGCQSTYSCKKISCFFKVADCMVTFQLNETLKSTECFRFHILSCQFPSVANSKDFYRKFGYTNQELDCYKET